MKQLSFPIEKVRAEFGGSLIRLGKRKSQRPLNFKNPIHLVLKAKDSIQLFEHRLVIERQIDKLSEKFGVRIYELATHEDHIHTALKFQDRKSYRAWIRGLAGTLSRKIEGLEWRLLPWTRNLTWGTQFKKVCRYIKGNRDEAKFLKDSWRSFTEFDRSLSTWINNLVGRNPTITEDG